MEQISKSKRIRELEEKLGKPLPYLLKKWHWEDNLRHREISKKLGIPRPTITRWFKQFNIPTQSRTRFTNNNLLYVGSNQPPRKKKPPKKPFPWHFDKEFFDKWSPKMAYVLGFMFADGYVYTNPRGSSYLCFCSTDKEIILKIKELLKSNHKIGIKKANRDKHHNKNLYTLQIGSKKVCHILKNNFGIIQNKTYIIKFPTNLPPKFLGDFTRGYFDGDGSIHFKKHFRKDRDRYFWIFQVSFTSHSKQFLKYLHDKLKKNVKISGGSMYNKSDGGYDLRFSKKDSLTLYRLMYSDISSELHLERKYNIFQKAIKVLKLK